MKNYYINQIENAEKDHDFKYPITIKLFGTKNFSNHMSITKKQLDRLKDIFLTITD